jgi:hypothetical protein
LKGWSSAREGPSQYSRIPRRGYLRAMTVVI